MLRRRPLIGAGDGASAEEVSKRQPRPRVAVTEHPGGIQPTRRLDRRYLIHSATTQLNLQELFDSGLSHDVRSVLAQASEHKLQSALAKARASHPLEPDGACRSSRKAALKEPSLADCRWPGESGSGPGAGPAELHWKQQRRCFH